MSLTRTENLALVRCAESLRRFISATRTVTGGFAGTAGILPPFALAALFLALPSGWEPMRLFVLSMAVSCAAVAVIAVPPSRSRSVSSGRRKRTSCVFSLPDTHGER